MAVERTSASQESSTDVQTAAELLLQREEERQQSKRQRARRRRRKRLRDERESVARMHRSIEVIKWCIVGICTVWIISFVVSIVVLIRVHTRVVEIEGQVQRIQQVMEHPFANVGARLGGDLDTRLKEWLQLPEPADDQQ